MRRPQRPPASGSRRWLAAAPTEIAVQTGLLLKQGAGNKAFTAGLDLKELGAGDDLSAANDQDPMSNPVTAIAECGKPVIGAINGVAITGGFELALACDILLASEQARFADTHALVGIMPGSN